MAIVALAPAVGWSATATLTASKDNSIYASNVAASNGGGAGIFVGASGPNQGNSPRRGLLAFDIANAIPSDATISNVVLTMYLGQANQGGGNHIIDLHRLTADWGEGTAGNFTTSVSGTGMGSDAAPGDATWTQRFFEQTNWTAAGAEGDYVPAISGSTTVSVALDTPFTWPSTPTLVSDVQDWLDHPSTNYGWILINEGEGTSQSVKAFYSRDATEKNNPNGDPLPAGWNPSLTITFTTETQPTGDYSGNGAVDVADYVVWRKKLGLPEFPAGAGADGDQSTVVDEGDYAYWRERFANPPSGFASAANIPEPTTVCMMFIAGPVVISRRRR